MTWEFTADVEEFVRRAYPLLTADPAENTLALSVVESVRTGHWTREALFGWHGDTGAALMTAPYELILVAVPDVDPLVAALRARGVDLPGVHGEVALAERFAAAWTVGTGQSAKVGMRLRLYALDELRPPTVEGSARRADAHEAALVVDWCERFGAEIESGEVDPDGVRAGIADGLYWLWCVDGAPVSLAARKPVVAGGARVGPVYTPAEQRRRGYGAAVTAAATADALAAGAAQVLLFTDLANPTSNAIYQQIGYRPRSDRIIVRFT
jgi:GNAT superfamily N-acetyltransferase